jgi:hypothetical protein
MTYKELKQYVYNKRKENAAKWRTESAIHGFCEPLTEKEYHKYREIIFSGKTSYKRKINCS